MKYRRLGNSGLKISEIGLGSWLTYEETVGNENATDIIHKAYDLGINFFDTANAYNRGEAEKVTVSPSGWGWQFFFNLLLHNL